MDKLHAALPEHEFALRSILCCHSLTTGQLDHHSGRSKGREHASIQSKLTVQWKGHRMKAAVPEPLAMGSGWRHTSN